MNQERIVVQPLQWAALPDIDDVEPLDDSDEHCLRAVQEVLEKHGKLDRFGINLIHSHFDMRDDECLVEYTDGENRELLTKVKPRSELTGQAVQTMWKFNPGGVHMATRICRQWCEPRPGTTGHYQRHRHEGSKVICTELVRQNLMSREDYKRGYAFARDRLSEQHQRGYHVWALHVVRVMRKSARWTKFWRRLAQARANQIAYLMGERSHPDLLGWALRAVGEPACWIIGAFVQEQPWRELYDNADERTA